MTKSHPVLPPAGPSWRSNPFHRQWLADQAKGLFEFFQRGIINPAGGFFDLDDAGQPIETANPVRQIHNTTRMVHCFAIGTLLGRKLTWDPEAEQFVNDAEANKMLAREMRKPWSYDAV